MSWSIESLLQRQPSRPVIKPVDMSEGVISRGRLLFDKTYELGDDIPYADMLIAIGHDREVNGDNSAAAFNRASEDACRLRVGSYVIVYMEGDFSGHYYLGVLFDKWGSDTLRVQYKPAHFQFNSSACFSVGDVFALKGDVHSPQAEYPLLITPDSEEGRKERKKVSWSHTKTIRVVESGTYEGPYKSPFYQEEKSSSASTFAFLKSINAYREEGRFYPEIRILSRRKPKTIEQRDFIVSLHACHGDKLPRENEEWQESAPPPFDPLQLSRIYHQERMRRGLDVEEEALPPYEDILLEEEPSVPVCDSSKEETVVRKAIASSEFMIPNDDGGKGQRASF